MPERSPLCARGGTRQCACVAPDKAAADPPASLRNQQKGGSAPGPGHGQLRGEAKSCCGGHPSPCCPPPQHCHLPQGARPWCGDPAGAPLWVLPPLFWLCQSPLLCSGGLCTGAELPPLMLRMPLCLVTSSSSCFPFRERSVPTSHPTLKRGGSGD